MYQNGVHISWKAASQLDHSRMTIPDFSNAKDFSEYCVRGD
jgi:hypothetical protein